VTSQPEPAVETAPIAPADEPVAGTPEVGSGVASESVDGSPPAGGRRVSALRLWLILAPGVFSLLGQGEQCRVDPRFVSPSATLATFWEALRVGDADAVWECFVEGRHDLPVPGQLWFLPPTDRITLAEFRSLPVTAGRVMVTYEVHYVPRGLGEEHSFRTGDELVRMRGQWRITRPLGQASMPDWEPTPRPVDI
jgi:hypothetical protein